ncbi:transmembrane and coiled-coil domain-containing protein 4 [Exaiptasia diaphana]|uniref:Transmembrane and coiled-coil domain-containing protein 4 n=1 Tax=Exaiptasia diaphana TaxID=2652724 RepID=A0A913X0Y2_EXADI|nr:transmembrane and coiled-coil domain-containing protein 4 [Exaiptasia diaphana]KXJ16332.1 Transmembrane and coiled-coil domain-containing protein 4 [Exaiptasia diaphana]
MAEKGDSGKKGNFNKKQINEILSKEGKLAFVRLCYSEIASLYCEKHERSFVEKYICDLEKYLDLPKQDLKGLFLCNLEGDVLKGEPSNNNAMLLVNQLKKECGHQNLICIPESLILFALETEKYDARHRVLIYHVAEKLVISPDIVTDVEDQLVIYLKECQNKEKSVEEKQRKEEVSSRRFKHGLLIGLGAIGGGVLLGVTGGLAAPFLAAGAGTLFGGSIGVALASVKGVAIITSIFGAAGAGLTGQKLNRRLGDIEQFEFEKMTKGEHLSVVIAVSGWLEDQDENAIKYCGFQEPWKKMMLGREQYCLKWESKYLSELGNAISSFLASSAIGFAAEEAVKHTLLSGLVSAVAWPLAILKVAYIIDNPWGVCASRSAEVGKHMAHVLMEKHHGNRPVSLVGFSFGARVIFHCLKALSNFKDGVATGIVQDVIMIGAPVTGDPSEWRGLEKVVAGRIVNCYFRKDWLLRFVYRTASAQGRVAGLKPVLWKNRRMFNFNVGHIVNNHTDYCNQDKIRLILDGISSGPVCTLDDDNSSSSHEDSGIASISNHVELPVSQTETKGPVSPPVTDLVK